MNRELSLETGRGRRRRSQSLTSETTSIFDCRLVVHLASDRHPKCFQDRSELSLRKSVFFLLESRFIRRWFPLVLLIVSRVMNFFSCQPCSTILHSENSCTYCCANNIWYLRLKYGKCCYYSWHVGSTMRNITRSIFYWVGWFSKRVSKSLNVEVIRDERREQNLCWTCYRLV